MKVLVACEYSGTVRDAFRALGHDAMSCDIMPSEQPGPHFQGDVRELLGEGFDLMIAHPPCTYLSYAGTAHWHQPGRAELREEALAFALELYHCSIPLVAMENPKGYLGQAFRPADQYINPFQFGEPIRKRTGLWLKGLPLLVPTNRLPAPPPCTYRKVRQEAAPRRFDRKWQKPVERAQPLLSWHRGGNGSTVGRRGAVGPHDISAKLIRFR